MFERSQQFSTEFAAAYCSGIPMFQRWSKLPRSKRWDTISLTMHLAHVPNGRLMHYYSGLTHHLPWSPYPLSHLKIGKCTPLKRWAEEIKHMTNRTQFCRLCHVLWQIYHSIKLHGDLSKQSVIFMVNTVRTPNFTCKTLIQTSLLLTL